MLGVVLSVAVTVIHGSGEAVYTAVGADIGSQPVAGFSHHSAVAPSSSQSLYSILLKLADALWYTWK